MAGVTEGVTIEGMIRTQAVLNDLLDRVDDLSPLMSEIGAYGEESTRHRFESQTGPDGKVWEKSERVKAKGGQTLVDSGRLRDSITWRADKDSAEWGTNLIYAGAHQFGIDEAVTFSAHTRLITQAFGRPLGFGIYQSVKESSRNPNIPARPFAGIDGDDEEEIGSIIHDYLAEAIP